MKYWIVRSKVDLKSVRIIGAKSPNDVRAHVYSENWCEPERAKVEDVAIAATNGVKPETADD